MMVMCQIGNVSYLLIFNTMKMILINKATIRRLLLYLLKETKNSTSLSISPDGSGNPRRDCNEQREKGWQLNTNDSL